MIKATLIYIVNPATKEVLLAKKTRKIGVGYYFGYGGKIEENQSADECACAEIEGEGGGITVKEEDLQRVGLINFYNGADVPIEDPSFQVLCYRATAWEGIPSTTEEMADPEWFPIDKLPQEQMKPGDIEFVPKIIEGELFKGWIRFDKETHKVLEHTFTPCDEKDLII